MSYHTFQVAADSGASGDLGPQQRPLVSRRISTSHACYECRRRKIRCDGASPCQQCIWYHHPELCHYSRATRKVLPSRAALDSLQTRVETLSRVCSRLFPGHDPEHLATLNREELVRLIQQTEFSSVSPESLPTPAVTTHASTGNAANLAITGEPSALSHTAQSSADAESLSALEQAPERDPAADEAQRYGRQMENLSDDVNALSISVGRKASYVGVSSISAALEVIFKVEPAARTYMTQHQTDTNNPPSRRNSQTYLPLDLDLDLDPTALPAPHVAERYIESYFTRVHTMMPMVDEQEFWHLYLYTNRTDAPWLALLNIVLALGALADPTSHRQEHLVFSHRVRRQFNLELFGSGNIFVLQALGLLTGYYLHWLSRPNEANALMGAALRMAIAMGLHREFSHAPKAGATEIPAETRRRTWWSLVCLDTYAAMTTGRPSLGRLGAGITVEGPRIPEQTNNAQYLASIKLLPIVHSVRFCKLATNIQDKLASLTILPAAELKILDAELVQWYDELPPILLTTTSHQAPQTSPSSLSRQTSATHDRALNECPEQLKTPRLVMKWWWLTLRVLAHRPVLLASALRRLPFDSLSEEERTVVSKCRHLAAQTIEDIDQWCPDEIIASWNAVWMMYQAVMVPMVSLFLHTSLVRNAGASSAAASDEEVKNWRQQIQTAIAFYHRKDVNISRKCKAILQRLYDANCALEQTYAAPSDGSQQVAEQWNAEIAGSAGNYLPMGNNDIDGPASDMNLDEWLQTYDEPLHDASAWNDMLWSQDTASRDLSEDALFQDFRYSTARPPFEYGDGAHSFS